MQPNSTLDNTQQFLCSSLQGDTEKEKEDRKPSRYLVSKEESIQKRYHRNVLCDLHRIYFDIDSEQMPERLTVAEFLNFAALDRKSEALKKKKRYTVRHAHVHHNIGKGKCKQCSLYIQRLKDKVKMEDDKLSLLEENQLEVDEDFPQLFAENAAIHSKLMLTHFKLRAAVAVLKSSYQTAMHCHFFSRPVDRDFLRNLYLSIAKSLYFYIKDAEMGFDIIVDDLYRKVKKVDLDKTIRKISVLNTYALVFEDCEFTKHLQDHRHHLDRGLEPVMSFYKRKGSTGCSMEKVINGSEDREVVNLLDFFLYRKMIETKVPNHILEEFMELRSKYFSDIFDV